MLSKENLLKLATCDKDERKSYAAAFKIANIVYTQAMLLATRELKTKESPTPSEVMTVVTEYFYASKNALKEVIDALESDELDNIEDDDYDPDQRI